jgi:hypothetical protein
MDERKAASRQHRQPEWEILSTRRAASQSFVLRNQRAMGHRYSLPPALFRAGAGTYIKPPIT